MRQIAWLIWWLMPQIVIHITHCLGRVAVFHVFVGSVIINLCFLFIACLCVFFILISYLYKISHLWSMCQINKREMCIYTLISSYTHTIGGSEMWTYFVLCHFFAYFTCHPCAICHITLILIKRIASFNIYISGGRAIRWVFLGVNYHCCLYSLKKCHLFSCLSVNISHIRVSDFLFYVILRQIIWFFVMIYVIFLVNMTQYSGSSLEAYVFLGGISMLYLCFISFLSQKCVFLVVVLGCYPRVRS